ncbi:MAG: mechanosensitive ion channel family protein [Pirellulaceae bacterium]|nr:mechanosensitive ion channel family protein [Pirellulaceae bacterium]
MSDSRLRLGLSTLLAVAVFLMFACDLQAQLPKVPNVTSTATAADTPAASREAAPEGIDTETLLQNLQLGSVVRENTVTTWIILLVAIFVGLAVGKIASWSLRRIGTRLESRGWQSRAQVLMGLAGPASLALLTVGLMVGLANVAMSGALGRFCTKTLLLLFSIAVFWYVFNLIAIVELFLQRRAAKTGSALDKQLAPLIRKTLRVFLVVVAALFIVDTVFEGDIGAWLAGLGIAGLAVSLAAQDSLKNLFGSITILLDRPFKVGERIVCSGYDGTVEEIGFRSTKVRTLTGHLVTIPNSNIVSDPVENIGQRPYIRRNLNVTITYDTPRDKIEQAAQIIRDILEEEGIHEPIHPSLDGNDYPPRVFFNDFNADSLNVFVMYWYSPPTYWEYLEHAHRLNLRIFEEYEKAGIEFAFPTQTLYLARDPKRELAVKMLGSDLSSPGGG